MSTDLNIHPPLPLRKDFRIGILGSGFIVSDCHLVSYRKAGFNPIAIASRSRENAAKVAAQHSIPKVYDTYEQLLDDPEIEVLDIAVPPNAQLALIKAACQRKTAKGILAQKPLGMNYAEALEAVELCEQAGITLAVNQNMRYDQSVRAAKTLLENGTIGEPVFATIDMRGVPHFMPWQEELGWVTLRIMSIHHIDCLRYWFGDPEGIYCSTRTDPRTKFPHTDGICTYILEYKNGLRCVVIDDIWTGPAKEGCPADIGIQWRIEGMKGLAIGDIGWCKDPYTSPSTIRYASKGDKAFHEPFQSVTVDEVEKNGKRLVFHAKEVPKSGTGTFSMLFRKAEGRSEAKPSEANAELKFQELSENDFTPRARQVLALANEEATRLFHNFIGTEHLLLGLVKLGNGVAANVLIKQGLTLEILRAEIEKQVGTGPDQKIIGNLPFTPRTKRVLVLASKEAKSLNYTFIGTEHLLLGIFSEGHGTAIRALKSLNMDIEGARNEILKELDEHKNP